MDGQNKMDGWMFIKNRGNVGWRGKIRWIVEYIKNRQIKNGWIMLKNIDGQIIIDVWLDGQK